MHIRKVLHIFLGYPGRGSSRQGVLQRSSCDGPSLRCAGEGLSSLWASAASIRPVRGRLKDHWSLFQIRAFGSVCELCDGPHFYNGLVAGVLSPLRWTQLWRALNSTVLWERDTANSSHGNFILITLRNFSQRSFPHWLSTGSQPAPSK